MLAIFINKKEEIRKILKELTIQVNNTFPDNSKVDKMKYVFKPELFYDIEPCQRIEGWYDVNFEFHEEKYGNKEIMLSLPGYFFVKYDDLNRYNLGMLNVGQLEQLLEYSISIEDYSKCSEIKEVINEINDN